MYDFRTADITMAWTEVTCFFLIYNAQVFAQCYLS